MESFLPAFIDANEEDQVREIRSYFKSNDDSISEETVSPLHEELSQLLDYCEVCFKNEAEMESVMNSILYLVLIVTEQRDELIKKCCDKLSTMLSSDDPTASARLRILSVLFSGLQERDPMRYNVYAAQLMIASKASLIDEIPTGLDLVKEWLNMWGSDADGKRHIYRLLYNALIDEHHSEEASNVMIELLSTYTEQNASTAKEDAKSCITSCLAKPNLLILDNIIALRPVASLKGEPIYKLLEIFVSGHVQDYISFYESNKEFVDSLGLSNELNLKKMRILTVMEIGVNKHEISFDELANQLDINVDDVEGFVIEAVQTSLVKVRLDQMNKRVVISSVAPRTFGQDQWKSLHGRLVEWRNNLVSVNAGLQSVVPAIQV
ncbi:eukaryotic translation initiation factor 3 subunit M-like [Actinia tenebrosa]|uniref:Eukaryotic translation initiation factor 3 subunit M n=1 Tax=Actinia tenebrosa TaxID=6105 RepID=A0A6P8IRN8_ACTTE|nr:eukaryotic translation initiation factor 3 subunit M-like [Actinia tenebrosa]